MEPAWRDLVTTASPRRPRRASKDAEPRTGLVDVDLVELAFEVPQIFLREIQRVDRFPRRDGLELDGLRDAEHLPELLEPLAAFLGPPLLFSFFEAFLAVLIAFLGGHGVLVRRAADRC